MFKRRRPLPPLRRFWEILWPRGGWHRSAIYVAHRLGRLPGTPYRVAAGVACGAAISFTPFMGFHFLGAALLAFTIRANVLASAIGTAVGNPWTFPFIWLWTYNLGRWLLGSGGDNDLPDQVSMHYIFDNFTSVFWPMTLGGLLTAVVAWPLFFWPVRVLVLQYQRRRRRRLRRRILKVKRKAERAAQRSAQRSAERSAQRSGERGKRAPERKGEAAMTERAQHSGGQAQEGQAEKVQAQKVQAETKS